MGGRGGSSGMGSGGGGSSIGFEYKSGGKTVTVQKTTAGVTLVNGKPSKMNYDNLKTSARAKEGYKDLSGADLSARRTQRYKDFNSHDEELLGNTRGKRKIVYRQRRNAR